MDNQKTEMQKSEALTPYRPQNAVAKPNSVMLDGMSIREIAEACANSGMFKDIRSAWQAIVKVKAGLELGIPPIQAMNGLYIIEGKVAMAATLMGGLIKSSGRYTYRILQLDENGCTIQFFERDDEGKWTPCGPASSFTMADANKAGVTGKAVWKAWPRNMLFSRAMSNGARWYCSDVFLGPVYVPEELGAEVTEEGDMVVVDVTPIGQPPSAPVTPPTAAPVTPPMQPPPTPPPGLVRNDWQRQAALAIYPKVAPEVADEVRKTGGNPLFSEIEFTQYLVKLAAAHVITLPDGIRPIEAIMTPESQPDVASDAAPLFDEDGELIEAELVESEVADG